MEDFEWKGIIHRINKCAFDFLSMEHDLFYEDDDDDDVEFSWEMMARDLTLKSTFLYCDLNRVISSSRNDCKKALIDLANKLFYFMEELSFAVKCQSISLARVCYNDVALALQEVVAALTPASLTRLLTAFD